MKASTELPVPTLARDASPRPTQSYVTDPLQIHRILVPVDFSDESMRAIDYALALAHSFRAGLHFTYVYDGEHPFPSATPTPECLDPVEATRCLKNEVERRLGSHQLLPGNCHIRVGRPFREIAATAQQIGADLIVVAAQGHTACPDALLGGTAEKIIRHAPCPVLVIREGHVARHKRETDGVLFRQLLVPVDFSECAKEGARYAIALARELGAQLLLLHVMPAGHASLGVSSDPEHEIAKALRLAESELEQELNFLHMGEVSADAKITVGAPVEMIVEETKRADLDLVVMSTHGWSGRKETSLGSVAEELICRAACPVLIVPSHVREVPKRIE